MAIEDNKGHSGQGAEGNAPAHQHPADTDARDVGQRDDNKSESESEQSDKSNKTSGTTKGNQTGDSNEDGRPGSSQTTSNRNMSGTDKK